jgi:hypothetical protein
LGGGGDEPMSGKGAGAQPLAMSPSTMRQWRYGLSHALDPMQLHHPAHVKYQNVNMEK